MVDDLPSRGKSWYLAKVGGSCSARERGDQCPHVDGRGMSWILTSEKIQQRSFIFRFVHASHSSYRSELDDFQALETEDTYHVPIQRRPGTT